MAKATKEKAKEPMLTNKDKDNGKVRELQEAVMKQKQERAMDCRKEIAQVLQKYECVLVAVPGFTYRGPSDAPGTHAWSIETTVDIAPK